MFRDSTGRLQETFGNTNARFYSSQWYLNYWYLRRRLVPGQLVPQPMDDWYLRRLVPGQLVPKSILAVQNARVKKVYKFVKKAGKSVHSAPDMLHVNSTSIKETIGHVYEVPTVR